MATAVLTIDGTPRTIRAGSLKLVLNVNGRSSLRVGVRSLDGSYSPDADDDVLLEDSVGTDLFRGLVVEPEQDWVVAGKDALVTTVVAEDYTAYAYRRLVKGETTEATPARDLVDLLVDTYLAPYGVTRDPAMPTGADVGALTYDYVPVADVMNDLVKLAAPAGWVWRINESKVLTAFAPSLGAYPCPFSITTGATHIVGDVKVRRSRRDYLNRVVMVYGDGTSEPAVVTADDLAEQGTYGIYEGVIRAGGPLDETTAQAIVDAYLAKLKVRPKTIEFKTRETGARPGQTLSVNLPSRGLSGDFLITKVELADIADANHLLATVTATDAGYMMPADWKEVFRQWFGGSGDSGIVATAGGPISVTVITGGTVASRATYWLGGSGIAGQQSPGPSALDAVGYVDVMLDSAAFPTGTSVTAVVQCRTASAGVSVTPRIRNITTGTNAGVAASPVTGTSWQTVTFPIVVTSGQNTYRLQMTPGAANVDCFCMGYLEVGR